MYNLNACSHYFTLVQTFSVFYGACCATTGDGLYEGLDWLSSALANRKGRK